MPFPWAIVAAISSIVAGGVSYVQAKKAAKQAKKANKQGQGLLINEEGTNNFIPVIYGTRRVAGTRVFVATNDTVGGDPNEFLYLVYVLCEGEVDDVTDILIDDLPVSDSRFAYTDSIAINIYKGTDAQTADTRFTSAGIGWTADHKLSGLCYITVRLKWNSNAFSSIPNITALVRGKKVYDPRSATTGYSTNPALCIRDYLTNARYGKGLDSSVLDEQSFEDAADFYDTTVQFWTSGTTGKLFEFNAVIDTEKSIIDNLKDMLFCSRGFLPYTNGVYQLIPDKSGSSSFTFTTDNMIGGIAIQSESKADKYNQVIVTFTDPDNNWQENTAIWPDAGSAEEAAYLAEDNGVELVGDFDLPCITNYYTARDLARVFLSRSRNALRCAFDANSDALNLSVGDVVSVTHPTPGWSAKPFQVEEVTINYDGTCRVALLEYDSSIYTYDPASEQIAYADTDLPNPFSLASPSAFTITETTYLNSDGSVIPEIKVEWTAPSDAFVDFYEFQFKKTTDADWVSVSTPETFYIANFAVVGDSYNLRVRSVNTYGVRSSFATASYTILGDTSAPAKPTGLAVLASYNQAIISWNASPAKDYKETRIYANTVNNSATATEEARASGTEYIYNGLLTSSTYYVWIKHEDFTGNLSVFSDPVPVTTTSGLPSTALADGAVTTDKINALAVTAAKVASQAIETAKIADLAVETGKLANAAATEAKIAANAITETKISNDAITTPKLAAGAVTAGKIAAGTITANEIAASTITGAKIAAGTITAGNIAALTITANEIAASTITGAKIAAGTITSGNIAAGAITAGKISADAVELNSLVSNTSKTYDSSNFAFEMGTSTSLSGYQGAGIFRTQKTTSFAIGGITTGSDSFAVGGQSTNNAAAGYGAGFVNSTTSGGTSHRTEAYLTNSSQAGLFIHTSSANNALLANATYAIDTNGDVYVDGDITATGTITPFTGSHDGILLTSIVPVVGDILVDTQIIAKSGVSEALARMAISSMPNQYAIGIYCGDRVESYLPNSVSERGPDVKVAKDSYIPGPRVLKQEYADLLEDSRIIGVNSVGEGLINVCGENGNISAGDLIVTSSISGKGMKQADDIIRSCTVAKARESVTFDGPMQIKQIACIYLCG